MASNHQIGVLEDNIAMWEEGGKKGLTLNTRAINIIWGGDGSKGKYWKRSTDDSSEFVELLGVYWLEVTGRFHSICSVQAQNIAVLTLNWHQLLMVGYRSSNIQAPLLGNKIASKEVKLSEHMDRGWVDVPDGGLEFLVPQDRSGMLTLPCMRLSVRNGRKVWSLGK
ncbi:uncharacterized protein LOC103709844 [Phoenix dactylifera]|uniref:Uncharacterized protein LOC103709844 n=1 Tax=Phoenix dactylifera TaxID=42345 RepID=A0A8B7C7V7_PHODC|nr:uncharacterized protein LOC103709844 [Phoenix dactylifera]